MVRKGTLGRKEMNARIRELAIRAKFMAEEDINKQISYNVELKAFSEKFAEMLVRECAKFMDDNTFYYDYGDWSIPEPKDMLKHFGVEE